MKNRLKPILLIAICSLFALSTFAQQTPQKFIKETDYLLYLPKGYESDTAKKWPLMMFLHGAGESGTDINKIKVHGPAMLIDQGKEFPFIIISPQAQRGWRPDELLDLVQNIIESQRVDEERVYLTGLSMGGYGTWKTAMQAPSMFAAIVPICGGGDPSDAWKLRNMPIWCFHGAKDGIVPMSQSETMVNAVKKLNPSIKFTIYPNTYHDSWIEAYNNPELYEWLLSKKRFKYTEKAIDPALLDEYAGKYLNQRNDTILLFVKDKSLYFKNNSKDFQLTAASDSCFFFNENYQEDISFKRNSKNKVDKVILRAWNEEECTKIE